MSPVVRMFVAVAVTVCPGTCPICGTELWQKKAPSPLASVVVTVVSRRTGPSP